MILGNKKKELKIPNPLSFALISVVVIFFAGLIFYLYFEINYDDEILPNVYVGTIDVSGRTAGEAENLINQKLDMFALEGVIFDDGKNSAYVYPMKSSPSGEILKKTISFDVDESIKRCLSIGKTGDVLKDFFDRFNLLILSKKVLVDIPVSVDHNSIRKELSEKLSLYGPSNAYYYIDTSNSVSIRKEVPGTSFDYDEKEMEKNLSLLDFKEVVLDTSDHLPEITEGDCAIKKNELIGIINRAPIVLMYEDWQWVIGRAELLSWISLKKDGDLSWDVDEGRIMAYVKENLSVRVDRKPESPKFSIEDGKVKDFQPGKNGSEVDAAELVKDIRKFILGGEEFISIKTEEVPQASGITDADVDFLGVEKVIGESSLSFAGSSASRIKNIKNGASKISGSLIKPGEEFSTVKTLSPIETSNGYVKEAVINGGTITHEVGGGLCHLSTTLFRTVLDTGLPITMRQNHSYDMSYYTPSGTDAAIYDPSPDFRFMNDTPHNILLMAWVDSTKLNIQIWGTDDGRVVERTKPVKYNIVYPRAAKTIKTANLATGVTQCSYAAYIGSDTHFDYKVIYPDGRVKEDRIKSHYVPRQGVCYVGI